ncbi:MAG: response regulator [Phycisphaerae bacterium]|nr:response regulator [Phycisphaerae bacterium]
MIAPPSPPQTRPQAFARRAAHAPARVAAAWAGATNGVVLAVGVGGASLLHYPISLATAVAAGLVGAGLTTWLMQRWARAADEAQQLRQLALDHHAIVSEADQKGRITYINDTFCEISGYSRDELLGQDHRIVNSGHHPKSFWKEMFAVLAREGVWHGEVCNRAKDGREYWVATTNVAARDTRGRITRFVSIRADITERKRAEAALAVKSQQLALACEAAEGASRAKSEFLANMSHEIRTPMTAILGFADVLAEEGDAPDTQDLRREALATIRRNGEHLLAIINDILDLSKIEAGKMGIERTVMSPAAIIQDVVALMRVRSAAKDLTLEVVYETPVPRTIECDPLRLRQILVNLIGNAIKFTDKGAIVVRVRLVSDGPDSVLRLSVQDSGIGMTPEQLGQIFGAFAQVDSSATRRFGGTGLGLMISKSLVEMLGGTMTVESAPARGSTFTFTLATGPLAGVSMIHPGRDLEALRIADPAAPSARSAGTLDGLQILLAEDGADNQRLIGHMLGRAGASVTTVDNGRKAVEAIRDAARPGRSPFHVVLMDMQMPEMDGYSAVRIIRSEGYSLPIIALTAHAMHGDREKCLDIGCDDYITKPIDRERLIAACAEFARPSPVRLAA